MSRELQSNTSVILGGREYIIQKTIGHGASCLVYHAICEDLTEHIIKEFNPRNIAMYREPDGELCLESEDDREEFEAGLARFREGHIKQRELRLDSNLKNSTSNVQGIFKANGTEYIDMTCFAGDSYEKVTEKSVYDLLRRMKALAQVIGNYHKAGLLHLDIKPENIFTLPETCEMVMLFDFDSVVSKEAVVTGGARSYTLSWAAPEQVNPLKRKNICEATDIFAVGEMIFYHLMGKKRHSTTEERLSFAEYEFDCALPIFQNLNPKVFPMLEELLHHTICVSIKQRYDSVEKLVDMLDSIMSVANPSNQQIVTSCPPAKEIFLGRKKELETIHALLQEQNILFVSGIGGIGKSEIAKQYASRYIDNYDTIIFTTYLGSFLLLVNDDTTIKISNFERPDGIKEEDYYLRKLQKLKDLCSEKTLLIIDNLNTLMFLGQEKCYWNDIQKLNCKKIITTRMQVESYPSILIAPLESMEERIALFSAWCPIEDETQRIAAEKIIEFVAGHTFTIELVAKQTYTGFATPQEKLSALLRKGVVDSGDEVINAEKDFNTTQGKMLDHITALFDMACLNDGQEYVISSIALLPPSGFNANLFSQLSAWGDNNVNAQEHGSEITLDNGIVLSPIKIKNIIGELLRNGWLERCGNDIRMHPIVSEVILKRSASVDLWGPFLDGIRYCLQRWEDNSYMLKSQLINCQQNLLLVLDRADHVTESIVHGLKGIGEFTCQKLCMYDTALSIVARAEKLLLQCEALNPELAISIKNSRAVILDNIGFATGDVSYIQQAIPIYKECIEKYELICDGDPINLASFWQNLACAYDNTAQYDLAEKTFDIAISLFEKIAKNTIKNEHLIRELANVYNNMGIHFKKIARYEDAHKYLMIAYDYATILGEQTEKMAKICHDIASVWLLRKDIDLAEAFHFAKVSLSIREDISLPESYHLAMSKFVLARCYAVEEKKENSAIIQQLLSEAKPIYKKVLGDEHDDVVYLSRMLEDVTREM